MALAKRQVYRDREQSFLDSRRAAYRLLNEYKRHADRAEGVASFVERRPPEFASFTGPIESEL